MAGAEQRVASSARRVKSRAVERAKVASRVLAKLMKRGGDGITPVGSGRVLTVLHSPVTKAKGSNTAKLRGTR